ncbi:tetratricopeptide repeat protein [Granulosicoccus sp. 3-233]|uniref:tetratricopeptide repeat protein n=1 Tax=Granulosicoccus sp. 3-233 TaxID=3417969 RepID=UPI003D34181C
MPRAERGLIWLVLLLSVTVGSAAQAFPIHYDTSRADTLRRCDQHQYEGRRQAARECYEQRLEQASGLERADAAAALGDIRQANKLYRELAADSTDPAIKTQWAKLYLQTHQVSDAEALFREALLYDASWLPARIGLAKALSEGFEGQARVALREIINEYPDNVEALLLLAGIELELQNLEEARGLLDRALANVDAQGLPPLEIYALHAGANLLEDKPMKIWTERALQYNPGYGDIHAIPAHFYIITYRYREAVDLYQKAVALDPELATAHRDLGINQLRVNNVFAARYHLQRAYDLDPFDAQTVNTLRLLDDLDGMRVSYVDVPYADDPDATIGRVLIRLDREDADALEPYVIDLAVRAVQLFSERYEFSLQKPMVVELYHDHDDFGVRTVSTPGIGLLGVTFGYLTAMDSPKARAAGEFHWGSTLWHEMAHVFTLEATNHRLPRWFSEGLSVYEEWNTGPLPDRELSMDVLTAIRDGQLLPVEGLDQGFVRPSYNGQVQVSYMQAGLICDFIGRRWGHDALVSMLQGFAAGQSTSEALHDAIGLRGGEFDRQFADNLQTLYGDLLESLDDYAAEARQLERSLQFDDWVSAAALSRDLIRRYPQRVGAGNPYQVLAMSLREQGHVDEAIEVLLDWQALGGHDPDALTQLIDDLRAAGRTQEAVPVMESLNWVMPYGTDVHRWLGEHYLDRQQPELALREFNALIGMQVDDLAGAYLGKARAARLQGDDQAARREVIYALESAPFYRPAQHLLLELSAGD